MAEVYKTRRLIIASSVFILIILIGFLTLRTPDYEYKLNLDQAIERISLSDYLITSEESRTLMTTKNSSNLIIDIRSHNEFLTDHIEGSTNIPLSEILKEDNFSLLKEADQENTTIVIIGKDLLQANASWLLLKQLGIKNITFLAYGFNLKSPTNEELLTETTQIEVQFFNDSIVKQLENPSIKGDDPSNNIKEKITPVKKQKKATTGGGC